MGSVSDSSFVGASSSTGAGSSEAFGDAGAGSSEAFGAALPLPRLRRATFFLGGMTSMLLSDSSMLTDVAATASRAFMRFDSPMNAIGMFRMLLKCRQNIWNAVRVLLDCTLNAVRYFSSSNAPRKF